MGHVTNTLFPNLNPIDTDNKRQNFIKKDKERVRKVDPGRRASEGQRYHAGILGYRIFN